MEWAELILEYVKALAWPVVVAGATLAFRHPIAVKIGDLKDASTPVGTASFFDRGAKAQLNRAEATRERQEEAWQATSRTASEKDASGPEAPHAPEGEAPDPAIPSDPGPDTTGDARSREAREEEIQHWMKKQETFMALTSAWGQLNTPPDFDVARGIAQHSPRAAVMLAFADLEKVARAAWTVAKMGPPGRESAAHIIRTLSKSSGLDPDFAAIAQSLADLRARITHGDPEAADVSVEGAIDFTGACEELTEALTGSAISKLRHPSRSDVVREWVEWTERHGLTDPEDRNEQYDVPVA